MHVAVPVAATAFHVTATTPDVPPQLLPFVIGLPLSSNVTLPVSGTEAPAGALTVAVKVTDWLTAGEPPLDASANDVLAGFTSNDELLAVSESGVVNPAFKESVDVSVFAEPALAVRPLKVATPAEVLALAVPLTTPLP